MAPYPVYPFGELKCDRSMGAWLHTQAAWYVEGEPGKWACRFKYMELSTGRVANECLDVEVNGRVLLWEEGNFNDTAEPIGGRMAGGRRERENKDSDHIPHIV